MVEPAIFAYRVRDTPDHERNSQNPFLHPVPISMYRRPNKFPKSRSHMLGGKRYLSSHPSWKSLFPSSKLHPWNSRTDYFFLPDPKTPKSYKWPWLNISSSHRSFRGHSCFLDFGKIATSYYRSIVRRYLFPTRSWIGAGNYLFPAHT